MTTDTFNAMRKAAAVTNPVWHAVKAGARLTRGAALCGSKPKTVWVDGGGTDLVTCQPCRRKLHADGVTEHETK